MYIINLNNDILEIILKSSHHKLDAIIPCFLLVVIILHFSACKKTSDLNSISHIRGNVILSSDLLIQPSTIAITDSFIIIGDRNLSALQIYSLPEIKYVATIGERGQGPGEFITLWSLNKDYSQSNNLWVYDPSLRRLTNISLEDATYHSIITLKMGTPYNPVVVNDTLIISPGLSLTDGRFGAYDKSGDLLESIGDIPGDHENSVPIPIHLQAYQGVFRVKPDYSMLAMSLRYADRIDIFKPNGNNITTIIGPIESTPIYEVVSVDETPVMQMNQEKTRFGYIDITVTNNYIYALFSGRLNKDHPGKANFGNNIHIYDWDGNFVQQFMLNDDVLKIVVDKSNQNLYAIREYPEQAILHYDISGLNN